MLRRGQARGAVTNPGRLVALAFAASISVGTALLMLPVASHPTGGADALTAAFTATSAVCVTGLVVVDTDTYWTGSARRCCWFSCRSVASA